MRRTWMAKKFCQPIYEEWLYEAVASGRIEAPGFLEDLAVRNAYVGAMWNGPAPGQIDTEKEANAAILRIDNCLSTTAKEAAELTGEDFDDIVKQRTYEEKIMREGGLKIGPTQVLADKQQNTE